MSAYKTAIDLTLKTVEKRAKNYRNLIAGVVIISICSIGSAVATWTFAPVTGLLLFFPVCGLFFYLDSVQLHKWRSDLSIPWIKKELDFWAFREAIQVNPHLPKATIQGMIGTLPSSPDWAMERAASGKTREAIAGVVNTISANHSSAVLVKATAAGLVAISMLFAVILSTWYPIMFILLIVPLWLLMMLKKGRRLRKLRGIVDWARQNQEFKEEILISLIDYIDWDGLPSSQKKSLIDSISSAN